jgi:hypothetical protein
MAVTYLTTDQFVALHERALEHGGLAGVRSLHALGSAVGQVEQTVFGEDAYPSIGEKAAAYAFFITAGHPFNDGNKRTAARPQLAERPYFAPATTRTRRSPGATAPAPLEQNGPSLFTAIQEQLGLKLDSTRGPVKVIVIDRAERPTED